MIAVIAAPLSGCQRFHRRHSHGDNGRTGLTLNEAKAVNGFLRR
jgi:hypothetical protein